MSKSNKQPADYAERIPTLTEIIPPDDPAPTLPAAMPTLEPAATPPKTAKAPEAKAPELPKDLVQTVERLVYKALYRQLPPLSKEISAEIIEALQKQLLDKKSR